MSFYQTIPKLSEISMAYYYILSETRMLKNDYFHGVF